jgi:hypothetical protein
MAAPGLKVTNWQDILHGTRTGRLGDGPGCSPGRRGGRPGATSLSPEEPPYLFTDECGGNFSRTQIILAPGAERAFTWPKATFPLDRDRLSPWSGRTYS